MPNGSAMKAVAKLVDEGKVMKHCLLWSFLQSSVFVFVKLASCHISEITAG